jgi:hypothetical protein
LIGINLAGMGNNDWFCENADLPWLQDTRNTDWWDNWGATYRDVIILDREGNEQAVFNLTRHDLWDPLEYQAFKTLLLEVAQGSN